MPFLVSLFAVGFAVTACARTVDVREFGAVGDGERDDAAAIQRALDVPDRPLEVIVPSGRYRIGSTLRIASGTHVRAARDARLFVCGRKAHKRGDFLLTNASHTGEPDRDISVSGGIWDGNAHDGHNVKGGDIFAKDGWSGATLNFRNVRGLRLADMTLANSVNYNVRMCQLDGFEIRNIRFAARRMGWTQDGLHFNGFCFNGRVEDIEAVDDQTNDDLLAFNADDSVVRVENYDMVRGPITNVVCRRIRAASCHSPIRLLSVDAAIRDVTVEDMEVGCREYFVNLDGARYCRTPLFEEGDRPDGVGRIKRVTIRNCRFWVTNDRRPNDALIPMETNVRELRLEGVARDLGRDTAPQRPFVRIRNAAPLTVVADGRAVRIADHEEFALTNAPRVVCFGKPDARDVDFAAAAWRLAPGVSREGNVLTVRQTQCGTAMASLPLDLTPYEGRLLKVYVRTCGEGVQPTRASYLGYKAMVSYRDAMTGAQFWPDAAHWTGNWDWKTSEVTVDLRMARPEKAQLNLGLQNTTGLVRFDLGSIRLVESRPLFEFDASDVRCRYSDELRNIRLLRGVMLPADDCKEDDFRTLRDWGATLARFQMTRSQEVSANRDLADYRRWVSSRVDHLLTDVVPWARAAGVRLVVDLHVPPGGREDGRDMVMFYDRTYANAFVDVWTNIAARCRDIDVIWAYDLINEPMQRREALPGCDYLSLQEAAARAVRAVDPKMPIVIESNGMDSPANFPFLRPFDLKDVIYQVHMYDPGAYTHQGVHARSAAEWKPAFYPDRTKGWDKAYLKRMLKPVWDFQQRHGAVIYVGEFSAIAWAPNADSYLRDCISIFREYGWHWTYHAFREWDGRSVEHRAVDWKRMLPDGDTPRKRVLVDGLRN